MSIYDYAEGTSYGGDISFDMIDKAMYYQKKYGFDTSPGPKGYNDATDAFRHAFMQAYITYKANGFIAKKIGDNHEKANHRPEGMPDEQWNAEVNMDLWNNAVGRDVGKYVKDNIEKVHGITQQEVEDWMAEKIYERMKKGDLITDPFKDKRDYKSSKYNGRIYTRNDILNMKGDEFNNHSKFIDEVLNNKTVWDENMVQKGLASGRLIFVSGYTRADGTKVSSYYRHV